MSGSSQEQGPSGLILCYQDKKLGHGMFLSGEKEPELVCEVEKAPNRYNWPQHTA